MLRHPHAAAGRDPDAPAIVWADEEAPDVLHSWTLGQLAERSAHIAEGLRAMGLRPGQQPGVRCGRAAVCRHGMLGAVLSTGLSTGALQLQRSSPERRTSPHPAQAGAAVAIDMPLTADAVAIYLGIVLAGCAAVSIADSFVAREIAARCRIAGTQAIFTQVG